VSTTRSSTSRRRYRRSRLLCLALAELQHNGYGQVVAQPGAAPSASLGEMSRIRTCSRAARISPSGGRSSKLRIIAMTRWIIPMPRAVSGSTTTWRPQLGTRSTRVRICRLTMTTLPQRCLGNLHPEPFRPARFEDRRALRSRQEPAIIDFEELDANLFQVPGAYHDQQSR